MTPMNNKSLFAHLCQQMDMLTEKKVTVEEARTQCGLVKQAHNLLRYELERARTSMDLTAFNMAHKTELSIRPIEPKGFDDTTNLKEG